MERKTPGKRIVSKGEYAKAHGQRAVIGAIGVCLILAVGFLTCVLVCLIIALLISIVELCLRRGIEGIVTVGACVLSLTILGAVTYCVAKLAKNAMDTAIEINPGVPLTRANTARLPAPDSLVRASEEPKQAQETVLLRAATETQERHEEQLLRAAAGLPE